MDVLIAEDDALSRKLSHQLVLRLGHKVRLAEDGLQAWTLIEDNPPDVLITDWLMPGINGIELCSRVRTHRPAPRGYIYIIFVTALDDRAQFLEAMNAGADEFLAKPLSSSELEVRLKVAERVSVLNRQNEQNAAQHLKLETQNIELQTRTRQDGLTGLANWLFFQDRIEHAVQIAKRNHRSVSLLSIDLDSFKAINDTYGHAAGDQVLQEVASRLRLLVRESDTVARLGGDEFAILLPETGLAGAQTLAEHVRQALAVPIAIGDRTDRVDCSIGIAVFPTDAPDASALRRFSDAAVYEAKALAGSRRSSRRDFRSMNSGSERVY